MRLLDHQVSGNWGSNSLDLLSSALWWANPAFANFCHDDADDVDGEDDVMIIMSMVMTMVVMLTMLILSSEHILHLATFALLGGLTKACIGRW